MVYFRMDWYNSIFIKAYHMQECIDNCGFGYSTQRTIKNLFVHLDKFAMELDIISKCELQCL